MSDCCSTKDQFSEIIGSELCPACNVKGKKVKIITLKSMLKPTSLDSLNAGLIHYFCSSEDCNVVYFDTVKKTYLTSEIKVSFIKKMIPPLFRFVIVLVGQKRKLRNM